MMLELRRQDDVARLQIRHAPRETHEIDRFGRIARPDHFGWFGCVDETRNFRSCAFECIGRARREFVHAAMDVRVIVRVVVDERVDDCLRLLRTCGRV